MNTAKERMPSGTNPTTFDSGVMSAGGGYVILDKNMPRDQYVGNCYRNNVLNIITDKSELKINCFVEMNVWDHVKFPSSYKERGSYVIWVNIPIVNRIVIIGVLPRPDEYVERSENVAGYNKRSTEMNSVAVIKNAEKGRVEINSDSLSADSGVFVSVQNKDLVGAYSVYCQGSVSTVSEKDNSTTSRSSIKLFVGSAKEDESNNILNIIDGKGFFVKDEFKNIFELTEEGIKLDDRFDSEMSMTETEFSLEKGNSKIMIEKDQGIELIVKEDDIIRMYKEDKKETATEAVLSKPLIQIMKKMLNKMSLICSQMQSLTVVYPAGVVNPTNITNIQLLDSQITAIEEELDNIKSETVKLT